MKRILSLAVLTLAGTTFAAPAWATNGDQMLGYTAAQWARGGAVVAAPVDATSSLHNPASVATLGVEGAAFDMGLGFLNAQRSIVAPDGTETDSGSELYLGMGNGAVLKGPGGLYFGLAGAGVSGLGVDFASTVLPAGASIVSTKSLFKIAPAVGWVVNDWLSVGASVHLGYQTLAMKSPQFALPQTGELGLGGALGATVRLGPSLQLGAAYTLRTDVAAYEFNGNVGAQEAVYRLDMDAPASAALGLAYRPIPKLLVEVDVKWIGFSQVMDVIPIEDSSGATVQELAFGWDDQLVWSLGVEGEPVTGLVLRAGYNYGASPIGPEDVAANLGSIAVMEHHASFGVTKQWTPVLASTLAYTRAFRGEQVTPAEPATAIAGEQNLVFLQLSYRI